MRRSCLFSISIKYVARLSIKVWCLLSVAVVNLVISATSPISTQYGLNRVRAGVNAVNEVLLELVFVTHAQLEQPIITGKHGE